MTSLEDIKKRIMRLYKTDPNIHINVELQRPRISLKDRPVVIKGVYPHIFQIEEQGIAFPKRYTLQYADVLLNHIEIMELGEL